MAQSLTNSEVAAIKDRLGLIGLKEIPDHLTRIYGRSPSYPQLWRAASAGRFLTLKLDRYYAIWPCTLAEIAELFALGQPRRQIDLRGLE